MKKSKLEGLSLNKKVISNLNAKEVTGGNDNGLLPPVTGTCTITITLLACTRSGCDVPTIGHDDGSWCISKDKDAWCGGRVIDDLNP